MEEGFLESEELIYPNTLVNSYEFTNNNGSEIDENLNDMNMEMKKYTKSSELSNIKKQENCAICMELLIKNEGIDLNETCELSCSHCYHANCINNWLIKKRSCPICREKCKLWNNELGLFEQDEQIQNNQSYSNNIVNVSINNISSSGNNINRIGNSHNLYQILIPNTLIELRCGGNSYDLHQMLIPNSLIGLTSGINHMNSHQMLIPNSLIELTSGVNYINRIGNSYDNDGNLIIGPYANRLPRLEHLPRL